MATLERNKMKSRLTTRNSFTGRAMERMTKEKLFELFNGDLNYLSWQQTYIQRRFHPEQYLSIRTKERRENFEKESKKHIKNENGNLINLTSMLEEEAKYDIAIQERFKEFTLKHNGNKPLLILDVDNTLIYVRFFAEELRINDLCTYFGDYKSVEKDNSKIVKIRLTLSLEITNNELIDVLDSERNEYLYWTNENNEIKKYKKGAVFEYPLNKNNCVQFIQCKIRKVEISACIIGVYNGDIREEIEIDFTQENDKLNKFEPPLYRSDMVPVDFIYEGFLVRLRPNIDEFMEYIQDQYDVVLYTSANKFIYYGLLSQLHIYINETLGRDEQNQQLLWNDVLYRSDCILKSDYRGKAYHQKDLTLFGCDLSRVVMVDNSPIVCCGQEPNLILISDFFGKDEEDDELMDVYQLLDAIASIKGDIRYFLCGLEDEKQTYLTQSVDLSTENKCLQLTIKLINIMKAYYNDQIHISTADTHEIHICKDKDIPVHLIDLSPIQAEEIFDDLQLNIITSNDMEEIILDDIPTRNRNDSTFIPPKHGKNDSIVSVRDLDVIKQEKAQIKKQKVSFFSGTNFENKGKASSTPTRKRKRSSMLNSMKPKPSSKALLKNSNHEDFFVLLLKQLTNNIENKDIKRDIMKKNRKQIGLQDNEINRLKNKLKLLEKENKNKIDIINGYEMREKENNIVMEEMKKDEQFCKDFIVLRENNVKLIQQLKDINKDTKRLTDGKNQIQDIINDTIDKKIKYIKNVNAEIEHYRELIKQIAMRDLKVTFNVDQ